MKSRILKLIFNGIDNSYIIKTELLEGQLRTEIAIIVDHWEELGGIKHRTPDDLVNGLVTDGYIELVGRENIWTIELCL